MKQDKKNLLIIEDDPGLQKQLRWSFDAYDVQVAQDRESALAMVRRFEQRWKPEWTARLEAQPMDFFLRQLEPHLDQASERLGELVGASAEDLLFVDNATFGMNIVAASALSASRTESAAQSRT